MVVVLALLYLGLMLLVVISPVRALAPLDSEIDEDLKAFADGDLSDDQIDQGKFPDYQK